jgi:cytochrome c556
MQLRSLALTAMLAVAFPAAAQFAKPEDAYKYRASVMTLQGAHMSRINAQLRSANPDIAVIQQNVAVLDTLNRLFFTAFPEGSDMVASSRAKPEIWQQQAKFRDLAERLNGDVAKLQAAAKSGDVGATRSAFQTTAQTCKACHDDFRRE